MERVGKLETRATFFSFAMTQSHTTFIEPNATARFGVRTLCELVLFYACLKMTCVAPVVVLVPFFLSTLVNVAVCFFRSFVVDPSRP